MILWPHQVEAIRVCEEAQRQPRSCVLVQLPTASGKSEIAQRVALRYLQRPFARALIVVPTAQILEQFVHRLASYTHHRIHIEKARQCAPRGAKLVVASQNSLWDRLHLYEPETLCIYDECHHANLDAEENQRVAKAFHHIVGLSASPWSRGCDVVFAGASRVSLSLAEAQASGVVAPLLIEDWCAPAGPHGLVFCSTNAEAEGLAAVHPGASWVGVNSGDVASRISAWRRGVYQVLYVNRMLSEGFDEPRCSRIWVAVESESDIRYVQIAGRVLRASPGKVARIHCHTPAIRQRLFQALHRAGIAPHIAG